MAPFRRHSPWSTVPAFCMHCSLCSARYLLHICKTDCDDSCMLYGVCMCVKCPGKVPVFLPLCAGCMRSHRSGHEAAQGAEAYERRARLRAAGRRVPVRQARRARRVRFRQWRPLPGASRPPYSNCTDPDPASAARARAARSARRAAARATCRTARACTPGRSAPPCTRATGPPARSTASASTPPAPSAGPVRPLQG